MKEEKEKQYKTHQIWIKKGHRMYSYFKSSCMNAKNMYNTTNFYYRQVYTSLTQNKELQPLQKEVLKLIEKNIGKMNDVQKEAFEKKAAKEETKPKEKRKKIKCNLFEEFTKENPYVDYHFLDSFFKIVSQPDYRSLPVQSSQGIMKNVFQNWKSFFASLKEYKKNPSKFKGRPRIPRYSRCSEKEVLFTNQDCVIKQNKFLKFPKTKEKLNIGKLGYSKGKLKQVRVIPKYGQYVVELVVDVPHSIDELKPNGKYMSIDIGIYNLATIVTNTGQRPLLVKGKQVKSINQYYNKMKSNYLGILRQGKKTNEGPFTSKRLEKLHQKRNLKLKDVFHKASYHIVKAAVEENVSTIFIGQNKDWKQEINIGKSNNQSFVHIPHSMLINMITYKAAEYGIKVIVTEESYTSKASFLDGDEIPTYEKGKKYSFSGKRIKRGLYRTKKKILLNADVNGAANIMKKASLGLLGEKEFKVDTVCFMNPRTLIVS
ncbi:RNA-guided endonuclease InsQ/TnpB family protein [Niallia sp. 01092]|uniref:RNA-guided endonuclease InsQ/TnpB family protein n=1 Tax=unclassified Niallia TaxID=2837522 RepID=UPI003FD301D5